MLYYTLTGLINAITSTFLGLLVYFRNRKGTLNRSFALFCLSVAAWSWAYIFWPGAQDRETALFWFRALHIGAAFIPVTYFHFVIVFLKIYEENKRALRLGYLTAFILFIFDFTPLFIKDMVPKFSFKYWAEPGILYHFFLLMFFSYAVYCWYLLFKAYRKSTEIKKEQIKYILVGTLIGFIGGSTNYPLWYNIPIPPIGNGLVALYVILTAYAITKHHLFGIRVILTEILVVTTAFTLLIQAVTTETLLLKILGGALFVFFIGFGYQLVRSVIREIELRAELEKAYAELERIDKAKTEFLSIASHQLRTPLSAIKGYISLILEGSYGKIAKEIKKRLENVYISNERLVRLVNDLLNVTRLEMGRIELSLEEISLEETISSMVEEMKIKAKEKNLYLKWKRPEITLPKISVDKDKIRQVILNLVDNAIKYTNHGGVTVQTQITNDKCLITVKDTGVGMEKEEIENLFEVMARGKAGAKYWTEGAGLGLYIARRFVELHNGKVWAESPGKNKGSTFYIELPVK